MRRALLLLVLLILLLPVLCGAQTPCSHWASPQGSGAACTQAQPCKVAAWWPLAGPGKTLCLKSGEYRGSDSMISPPAGVRGTPAAPITVRAETDGGVLLDAAHQNFAVSLGWHNGVGANDWFIVEGINAKSGLEAIYSVASSNSILRRVIGWDGTSGAPTQGISIVGYNSRAEDCAGWGMNLRKIFQGSQAGNLQGAGYRRCWGEFNDWPQSESNPTNTLQIGYNSTNQLFENMVMTWDTLGQGGETEGIIGAMTTNTVGKANDVEGTRLLGSILYVRPGSTYSPATVFQSQNTTGLSVTDLAMIVPPGYSGKYPAYLHPCGDPPCARNVCTNCLAVHDGRPLVNASGAGWTLPGLRQGNGLQTATGGRSAFELLPGMCKRYEGGQLTAQPLWPWPMNDRIKAARLASGYRPTDVTAEVEQALGPIPAACKTGAPPGPGTDTTPPVVAVVTPTTGSMVSGRAVSVLAEASDNVGVVGVQWLVNGEPHGAEETSLPWGHPVDTTQLGNGVYTLAARARDAAGNVTTSAPVEIQVVNGPIGPARPLPLPPEAHPALVCSGELGVGGLLTMRCEPQGTRR